MRPPEMSSPGWHPANDSTLKPSSLIIAPPDIGGKPHEDRKPFETLRAKLALKGYSLSERSRDGYLIARWNLSRHLLDLRAVGDFLRAVGGSL